MSDNSNSNSEVVEMALDIENSLLLKVLEMKFLSQSILPKKVIDSYISNIGSITEDKEKDQEVTESIINVAGRMLISEIVYAAMQQALEENKNGNSILQESNTSSEIQS